MSICEELQELYPAYVLDAVSEADRVRIEQHLAQCANCSRIVASYQPAAAALAYAAPQVEPPIDLKYRVLAATMPKSQPGTVSVPSWLARWSALFRAPAFSAVALVLILALAVWNVSLQNQVAQQAAFNRRMADEMAMQRDMLNTMAYANGQPRELQGTPIASRAVGRLYGPTEETTFALIVNDLPALPPGKVYQFWLIDASGDRTSGGTFTVDDHGRGWLLIHAPKPLSDYQGVGITMEPLGGSPEPTGEKMMGTNL
jgi:anti-sigma-K factor RskA